VADEWQPREIHDVGDGGSREQRHRNRRQHRQPTPASDGAMRTAEAMLDALELRWRKPAQLASLLEKLQGFALTIGRGRELCEGHGGLLR
jgi:hypothetical protein